MKLRPLQDRVLIRLVVPEAVRAGFIPDTAQEKPVEGESWPSAPARATRAYPLDLVVGDHIAVRQMVGHEDKVDGQADRSEGSRRHGCDR